MSEGKKRGVLRRVGRVMNPFSPLTSMKRTVGSGWQTIQELQADLAHQRRNPRIRTFREAMAARPADAVPLEQIQRSCLTNKRIALAFGFLALVYALASLVPGNLFGAMTGLLFTILCAILATRYAHRSWQIAKGQASPDEPLGGVIDFLHTRGFLRNTFNPQLFD
ncbi:hypothetical protein [Cupriavidus taiwanensis]|uniref:Uncharacterized protein n=1 Tax=Cupriavidus taiwanensis TaxID=164546 RepID=A0A7Z7JHF7_9BURK|nr:hypothetical protein [Cupriavidus taiwanensis]SOZ17260.1 conserved hypothetical protein [Cupriavidus taiwanensis]SOZ96412.1 conserved hypothetical protein [Cupriavidus taiwanensis]SPC25643.1 conserved hypothetical protein [Cupriavidus taiwanensis]